MQNRNRLEKPHICFVAPHIYPVLAGDRSIVFAGGAEVQQSFLARGLRDAGYRVSVATNDYGQPDETEIDGIRVHKIVRTGPSIPLLRFFHPRLTSVWQTMGRVGADIYYQRTASAVTFVVGAYARLHGKRFIYAAAHNQDFHHGTESILNDWRDRILFYFGLRCADAIVAQNSAQLSSCREWRGREAIIIPSCYPAPPAETNASHKLTVLWVAMMRQWKRAELFLDLAESLPQLRFRMIGGPSASSAEDSYYTAIANRAHTLPNVEFLGFVPHADLGRHFDDARVFVNTSESEGFPNTFLQSWARGVPTVSFFDCGARAGDRPVGLVVDDAKAMQEAVSSLCSNDALWVEESACARQYLIASHSLSGVIARYEALIDSLSTASTVCA